MNIYLENLAQSIYYWLNYNNTVSKSSILIESSVRYPLAECIERRIGTKVDLEVDHKVFDGLKVDFYYKYHKEHYIELKYLHDYSNNAHERKRYFDDLIRLATLEGENYFILCGSREYLENRIKRFLPPIKNPKDMSEKREAKETDFPKWLAFDKLYEPQTFCPTDFWDYVGGTKSQNDSDRKIPNTIKAVRTLLVAKQDDEDKGSQVVYIWEVKNISD